MKKLILFTIITCSALCFASPIIFYNTYGEYKSKKGHNRGELSMLAVFGAKTILKVMKNGEKVTFGSNDLEKIWCFELDSVLFRCYNGELYEVLHVGEKVTIYKGALDRVDAMNKEIPYNVADDKYAYLYFSKGPSAEVEMILTTLKGKIKESLREKFPGFSEIFDNLEKVYEDKKNYSIEKAIKCFVDFDQK